MALGGEDGPRCEGSPALLRHLAAVAVAFPQDQWKPREVAITANGMSREGVDDERLFQYLSAVTLSFEAVALDPLNVANIANAYAKLRVRDMPLMAHLAEAAMRAPPEAFSAQAVANIVNAFARVGTRNSTLFSQMAAVALSIPPREFTLQNIGNLMNGMARAEVVHHALAEHLMEAWFLQQEECHHDPQAVCNVLHALASLHMSLPHWEAALLSALASLHPTSLIPQGLANVAWAVAVLRVQDPRVLRWVLDALGPSLLWIEPSLLRQVHQFLLWCDLERPGLAARYFSDTPPLDGTQGSATSRGGAGGEMGHSRRGGEGCTAGGGGGARAGERGGGGSLSAGPTPLVSRASGPNAFGGDRQNPSGVGERPASDLGEGSGKDWGGLEGREGERWKGRLWEIVRSKPPPKTVSCLQADVVSCVMGMGLEHVEEFVDARSGYSLDILLPSARVAIEVDGPYHYAADSRRPLGATVMKRSHLALLGYELVSVPYWEWDALDTREEKQDYLRDRLEDSNRRPASASETQ
ncbi:RAP domain-containing protein [Baffinella frigidus]|nr:RAP domain-containing protein [Cryptophyta sp. CCMP2293]